MRATVERLNSRKLLIGLVALLVLGLMAGLAFANSGSELPDISGSPPPVTVPRVNETLPSDSPEPVLPFTETGEGSDESDEDSDHRRTVGSEGVFEREDIDD